ncbi:MAG: Na+/H+ antiporter subunit E [Calditrichaeota bacterium]|nr:Na+/H+ antiporter subunit E [Calditrichota bacterium]
MATSSRFGRFLFSLLVFFAIWIAFTSSLDPQELIVGFVFSFISAYFYSPHFNQAGLKNLSPKKVWYLFVYLFVFFWEMVKANLDVAYRVLHPKMPIRPAIVEFRTRLKSNVGKLALANSITLTPGTLTVDVLDDRFFIHWIWAPTDDEEQAYREIAAKFERYLREIYE